MFYYIMTVISDLFLHSFVRGAGKTVGAFFIMGIAGSVWYIYTNQENHSLFKKPKIVINFKKDDHDEIKTTYSDNEQIDNDNENENENENEFDNSKIIDLFDTLIR